MLTEIVIVFAERWNSSPFDVLNQDIDDFILIANSLVLKAESSKKQTTNNVKEKKQERIRVNDKTATGGWW